MIKLKDKTILFVLINKSSTRVRVRNHTEQLNFCVCAGLVCNLKKQHYLLYYLSFSAS